MNAKTRRILGTTVGILIVAASVYVCYRYADVILRKLGATGTAVLMRLSAFILLCIGVQIMLTGISAFLGPLVAYRNVP